MIYLFEISVERYVPPPPGVNIRGSFIHTKNRYAYDNNQEGIEVPLNVFVFRWFESFKPGIVHHWDGHSN